MTCYNNRLAHFREVLAEFRAAEMLRAENLPAAVEAWAVVADAGAAVGAQALMKPLAMARMRTSAGADAGEVEAEGRALGGAVGAAGVGWQSWMTVIMSQSQTPPLRMNATATQRSSRRSTSQRSCTM